LSAPDKKAITEDELSEWLKINKIATAEDIMDHVTI
jgi:hypothetical protein